MSINREVDLLIKPGRLISYKFEVAFAYAGESIFDNDGNRKPETIKCHVQLLE